MVEEDKESPLVPVVLQAYSCGKPLLVRGGGVTPPGPDQYGTLAWRKSYSVREGEPLPGHVVKGKRGLPSLEPVPGIEREIG
jgi:hypothetical protein